MLYRKLLTIGALLVQPCYSLAASPTVQLEKITVKPNPTGLKFGFWEVYNRQADTLNLMGKRPISRVGFDSWKNLEPIEGSYQFDDFENIKKAHRYGEEVYAAVNIMFPYETVGDKTTIPKFYKNDISNDETQEAARKFLYAYVTKLLENVGKVTLTIDYEVISNLKFYASGDDRDKRAEDWGKWYVKAAKTARKAAADFGHPEYLKLQPIVNGDPFEPTNPMRLGGEKNPWLVKVVEASDYLALDTYHSDPKREITDPGRTIEIIQFWLDNYAGTTKEVIVTENGFSSVTTPCPNITARDRKWKLTGTEAEQALYYENLFTALLKANHKDGVLKNRLRGFSLWSIVDNKKAGDGDCFGEEDPGDIYFGLADITGKVVKPAAKSVRDGIDRAEQHPLHKPFIELESTVNVLPLNAKGIDLVYRNSDDFEYIRYTDSKLLDGPACFLFGHATQTGSILVKTRNRWVYSDVMAGDFEINLGTGFCDPRAKNVFQIQATGASFPATQNLSHLDIRTTLD